MSPLTIPEPYWGKRPKPFVLSMKNISLKQHGGIYALNGVNRVESVDTVRHKVIQRSRYDHIPGQRY